MEAWIRIQYSKYKTVEVQEEDTIEELKDDITRSFKLWKKGYDKIVESNLLQPHDHDLMQEGVLLLRRAMNKRIRTIESYYGLSSIKYEGKNSKTKVFDVLEHFNIVRKYTLIRYTYLRNKIEYDDYTELSYDEAIFYSDYIWMLLKATDSLLINPLPSLLFSSSNNRDKLFLEFEVVKFGNRFVLKLFIYGNIEPLSLSFTKKNKYLNVTNFTIINRDLYSKKVKARRNSGGMFFRAEIDDPIYLESLIKNTISEGRGDHTYVEILQELSN